MDKIFDTTKAIEEYDRTARSYLSWITPIELRSVLVKTHEAQVEVAKLVSSTFVKTFSFTVPTTK